MIRLTPDDLDWATALLTDAFVDMPPCTVLFRGADRRAQTAYFMRCTCSYALQFGEAHATPDRTGVALWLLPAATAMTLGRMHKAGMLSAPFRMGLKAFLRFMAFASHTDAMHRHAIEAPHYYLFALGVAPGAQRRGIGRLLTAWMLERIDRERMPAYLETQEARNVPLYASLGFLVGAQAPFPKLEGLVNWGMVRAARPST